MGLDTSGWLGMDTIRRSAYVCPLSCVVVDELVGDVVASLVPEDLGNVGVGLPVAVLRVRVQGCRRGVGNPCRCDDACIK